jgi:hypothetical protein
MIVSHAFFKIPTLISLSVIVVVMTVAIVASFKKKEPAA